MASNISEFERITKLLENKNVCLVGNSIELLNHNKGAFIDSHDVVIRMGRGAPTPQHRDRIGDKFSIWATGFLRNEFYKKFPKEWEGMPILLNRTRMYLNKPRTADIDVPYCTMFSDAELLEIYEEFNYQDASLLGRPSNGFIVLLWLIKKAWVWKSLTIIGFDFFAKQAPFKVGAQNPFSWHLPKNRVDEIPHNALEEREYALEMSRNGIINWIMLSDLKEEVLEL